MNTLSNQKSLEPVLSVIIPVFNEQETIGIVINKVQSQPGVGEIIVVNDGSTDSTANILASQKNIIVKIISHQKNTGKGSAIKSCQAQLSFPFMIIQDADLELNPYDFSKILDQFMNKHADVVYGSRYLGRKNRFTTRYVGNRIMTIYTNLLTRQKLTDVATGYKAMKTSIFKQLNLLENGFSIDAEITAKVSSLGFKIIEVPVSYEARTKAQGKKIRTTDAFKFFYSIIKYSACSVKGRASSQP
jgi:glycosyltransferase involved in cell wall biosynthesis